MTLIDLEILEALADIKLKNETETDKFSRETIVELISEVRKLRKVAYAARIFIDCGKSFRDRCSLIAALKEWKGEA